MTLQTLRPLTPTVILRATAPRLDAMAEQAHLVFMARLRQHAPALAASECAFRDLSQAVLETLVAAAPAQDRPDLSRDVLVTLALHLRSHGMAPRGYIAIHTAFCETVADRLGTDLSVAAAWETAVGKMLATMMAAAHGPRSHTTPLAA